jgi:hypothetical protein
MAFERLSQHRLACDDCYLPGYQALLQDICRTAYAGRHICRIKPFGGQGALPFIFYFPEEFIGGYWPWNSFAGLMSWVGGVW